MALKRRQGSDRIEYILVECPACGADLSDTNGIGRTSHIAEHTPADFGLTPLAD